MLAKISTEKLGDVCNWGYGKDSSIGVVLLYVACIVCISFMLRTITLGKSLNIIISSESGMHVYNIHVVITSF